MNIRFDKGSELTSISGVLTNHYYGNENHYYSNGPFDGCKIDSLLIPSTLTTLNDCAFGGSNINYLGFESPSQLVSCVTKYDDSGYYYYEGKNGAFRNAKIGTLKMPDSFAEYNDLTFNVMGYSETKYPYKSLTGSINKLLLQDTKLNRVKIPSSYDFKNKKSYIAINEVFLSDSIVYIDRIYCNALYSPRIVPPEIYLEKDNKGNYVGPKPTLYVPVEGYQDYYDKYGQYMTIIPYVF